MQLIEIATEEIAAKEILSFVSNIETMQSIPKHLKNLINRMLPNEPEFIKENITHSIVEAVKQAQNDIEFQEKSLRTDWYSENTTNNPSKIFYRTIKSMLLDIQCKKSRYIGSFWKNIQLMENSRIDAGSAFEYFDIIDSISYRCLCIIKFIIEYDHGHGKWEYDPVDDDKLAKKINQMNQDDKHKFHNISREMLKLIKNYIISGTQAPIIEDYKFCASHMLLATPTYLGKDLYDLMDLDKIPDKEIIGELSVWNVRINP